MANAGAIDVELARSLFRAAVELKPEARAKFVQDGSPNEKVRLELERLLREHDLAGNTISTCGEPNWEIQQKQARLSDGEVLAGRFKIIRFVAAGGMGEVYEADDIELRERVAIKTIHPDILQRPDAVVRFKREVHLARQVTHPNVCRIYDLFRHTSSQNGSLEEIIFVSMEFLCGKTLSTRLKENGRMSMQEALPLVEQMAAALSAAHDAGIVHHDFKPGNVVLVGCDNAQKAMRVVVTDFGLASRSISSGVDRTYATLGNREVFGTPAYMAPEQIEGRPGTIASDIYALGLVIYEMLTGAYPFDGNTPMSIAMKRLSEAPIPPRKFAPDLSAKWEAVVLRCLERDPAKRFSRAQEISAALANGSQLGELGEVQNPAGSLAVDEHSSVERQQRVLEAAAPKESAVGRSTEVVAMVRRIESGGLRQYLDNEVVPSVTSEDVRERPFELDFVLDERGKAQPVEICLKLDSPDFQPPTQTKKLRVPPRGDSVACTFLIRPTVAGELVANLELLKGEEVVVSRSIRTRALAEGMPVREGINIVSIPLTITVQDSVVRVAIPEPGSAARAVSLERIHRDSTGTHLLPLGERIPLEAEGHPQAVAREQKAPDKAELEEQELAEQVHRRAEAKDSVGGKAVVAPLPQALKNTRVLAVSGAFLLAMVGAIVWMLIPGAVPVEVKSTPIGTTVRVVSTGEECVTPYCSIQLRPGKHELEFSHPGYITQRQTISVQAKTRNIFPTVMTEPAVVAVLTEARVQPGVASSKPTPPPATSTPQVTENKLASMHLHGFNRNAHVYLDDKLIGGVGSQGFFSSIPPGSHEIKVVDKQGESSTMQKSFAPGEPVYLAKNDFPPSLKPPSNLPPPKTGEPDPWPKVAKSRIIDQLEQYRSQHPNSPHLGELEAQLDDLYWQKAMGASTVAGFEEYLAKSPNGKHRSDAEQELAWSKARAKENQRFEEARNSTDKTILEAFLKDYPTGIHHEQIYGRLDDLLWLSTNQNDKASLRVYISQMSAGKHVGQANDSIEKLNEAANPRAQLSRPAVDKVEVLKVVERYIKAYNDTSIEELRQIWPGMDKKRVSNMHAFFKTAQNVRSSYTLLEEPKVNGADATVTIEQVTTFILEEQEQRQSGTLTLKLKLVPGTSDGWQISSVTGN